jgi:hypothetical protein
MKKTILFLLVAVGFFHGHNSFASIVTDTFDGPILDSSKWDEYTPANTLAWTSSSVYVSNGNLTLVNRGTISTKQSFETGFDIIGKFRFEANTDRFIIWTRTTGTPSTNPWKEVDAGIAFIFQQDASSISIGEWTVGGLSNPTGVYSTDANCYYYNLASDTATLPNNTWLEFRVTDDGYNLAFYLNDLSIPQLTAVSSLTPGAKASFNNSYDNNQVSIDYITITSSVPEPSTYALFGIGAIGMLMVMRRKKKTA